MIDSAFKKDENYYPQVFLEESKYIEKEVIRHITEDMEVFSSTLMKNRLDLNIMMCFENVFFEKAILEMCFLMDQFSKYFFERTIYLIKVS